MSAEYSQAVRELMAMTDEVVPASVIAPIIHVHPSVMISQAKKRPLGPRRVQLHRERPVREVFPN